MSRIANRAAVISLALAVLPLAQAAAQDTTGLWTITAMTVPNNMVDARQYNCTWTGTFELTENGGMIGGKVTLSLDPTAMNDDDCPMTMTADLSGTNNGGLVSGTIDGSGSNLGQLAFKGNVVSALSQGSAAAAPSTSASGTFSVTSGPFNLNGGSWSGTLAATMPDLPQLGLALLLVLLFGAGSFLLMRRRRA